MAEADISILGLGRICINEIRQCCKTGWGLDIELQRRKPRIDTAARHQLGMGALFH
jgi:hypothetical protein